MTRTLLTAAVAMAAAFAVPSLAHGATLYQDGRTPHRLLLQDATGEANLIQVEGSKNLVIRDLNAPIVVDDVPTCMPIDEREVSCAAVRRLELDLGPAGDFANINTLVPVAIEGGPGPDRYIATATDGPSRVSFAGGVGLDTVNYFFATAGVNVAVDLEARDGRPGDEDRIFDDVERVLGSQFDDVLVGSRFTRELHGFDGDDQITGGSGAELLRGDDGNDRIDARDGAADVVDCGGGGFDWAAVDLDAEASITSCEQIVS